jgi:hypothetical protein
MDDGGILLYFTLKNEMQWNLPHQLYFILLVAFSRSFLIALGRWVKASSSTTKNTSSSFF